MISKRVSDIADYIAGYVASCAHVPHSRLDIEVMPDEISFWLSMRHGGKQAALANKVMRHYAMGTR